MICIILDLMQEYRISFYLFDFPIEVLYIRVSVKYQKLYGFFCYYFLNFELIIIAQGNTI